MDELQQAIIALRDQVNATLAGLPPLEQYEASSELSYGIRSLTSYANNLKQLLTDGMSKVQASVEKYKGIAKAEAEAAAKDALLATGGYVAKTDADAAVTASVARAEAATRTAIVAEQQAREKVAARRQQLVTEKKLPAIVAEKLPDAAFASDDALTGHVTEVSGRLARLTALGLTAEKSPLIVAEIAELPVDEAGKATADRRIKGIEESVRAVAKTAPVNPLLGLGGATPVQAEALPAAAGVPYF